VNCCPGSMDCGEREREGVRSGYSTVGRCSTMCVSVRKSASPRTPLPRPDAAPVGVLSSSVKPDHTETQFPGGPASCDVQAKQPLARAACCRQAITFTLAACSSFPLELPVSRNLVSCQDSTET